MQKVLIIIGPTAVGKTALSLSLAKRFNGEIISGDSIQVYKGLDIGSAKADKSEREEIPHHLIDILSPKERYSVADFRKAVDGLIPQLSQKGKLPMIVGGTGLYIRAAIYDYSFSEEEGEDNPYEEWSNEELYKRLKEVDPRCLEKIHVNNRVRLLRAYNVYQKTGIPFSEHIARQNHEMIVDAKIIALTMDRQTLYKRIDDRIDKMMADGLKEEIDNLLQQGVTFADQSMQGIGYKEFIPYYKGECTLDEVTSQIKSHTHRFAKRQYTWIRHQLPVSWYEPSQTDEIEREIAEWLTQN